MFGFLNYIKVKVKAIEIDTIDLQSTTGTISSTVNNIETDTQDIQSKVAIVDGVVDAILVDTTAIEIDTTAIEADTQNIQSRLTTIDNIVDAIVIDTAAIEVDTIAIEIDTQDIQSKVAIVDTVVDRIETETIPGLNTQVEVPFEEMGEVTPVNGVRTLILQVTNAGGVKTNPTLIGGDPPSYKICYVSLADQDTGSYTFIFEVEINGEAIEYKTGSDGAWKIALPELRGNDIKFYITKNGTWTQPVDDQVFLMGTYIGYVE